MPKLIEHAQTPCGDFLVVAGRRYRKFGVTHWEIVQQLETELALDSPTVALLGRVLAGLCRGEHLLIEGDPGTSKTTIVQLAAALLGLDVCRISFSRETDSGDFLGKFAPDEESGGWCWQDGPVVATARAGGVLYLDEINLARPAHVDRLLPLLERQGTLTLPEHRGESVAIHPHLRVVATINSVEDEGRVPLSRPFRDRMLPMYTQGPDVKATEAMLKHWVGGRAQSTISVKGVRSSLPVLPAGRRKAPSLATVVGIDPLLPRLARFHSDIEQRCRDRSLGRDRREAYSVGRRRLATFVQAIEFEIAAARRERRGAQDVTGIVCDLLEQHYVETVEAGPDRQSMADLARNHGLLRLPPGTLQLRAQAGDASLGEIVDADELAPGERISFRGEAYLVALVSREVIKLSLEEPLADTPAHEELGRVPRTPSRASSTRRCSRWGRVRVPPRGLRRPGRRDRRHDSRFEPTGPTSRRAPRRSRGARICPAQEGAVLRRDPPSKPSRSARTDPDRPRLYI